MGLFNITFSPTGGTKKVADILARALDNEVADVDFCDKLYDTVYVDFNINDVCLFAVPSYGGRVPKTAIDRIMRMTGGGARAIALVVYGNREQEDTLLELCDTLKSAGFCVVAGVCAIAEHSVIRKIAAGRPDKDDEAELFGFAEKISEKLKTMTKPESIIVPGNTPYKSRGGSMKPASGAGCIKCGKCALECPVDAIPFDAPSSLGNDNCISCMRCISVCPTGARKLDDKLVAMLTEKLSKVCSQRKKCELYI